MKLSRNIITLTRNAGVWVATFTGPHARETVKLFGKATLITAFSTKTPAGLVAASIKALNPAALILIS